MTAAEPEQQDNGYLSHATLTDDNSAILLNGDQAYRVKLRGNITKKKATEKQSIIEKAILEGCERFYIDSVNSETVTKVAKEIVNLMYERARVTKNYVPPPSAPVIVNQYKNDYFEYLIECAKRTIKEEDPLIRQIMYTTLSADSNDPGNLGVLAPTSAGKTYPIMQCKQFTPGGKEVRIVGSMSPKTLVREQGFLVDRDGNPISKEVRRLKYAIMKAKAQKKYDQAEDYQDELAALLEDSAYIIDMTGKTLIFLEPPNPDLWNLIKPILSHDYFEIEHPFVDNVGHGLEVKRVITRGWPACIFCSAKDESRWDMWPEIESRFSIVSPNMIKAKYQAGNKLTAQKKGLPKFAKERLIISEKEKELGQKCFLFLKRQIQQYSNESDSPVWIPYTNILGEIFPADKGTDNRSFNRFISFVNIIALSKGHLRHKLLAGDEELVIATLEDLREALHIMQNVTGLPPHKLKFYKEYILPLYRNNGPRLQTRDICDFYNVNNKKSGNNSMNADNLRKNYLQELVNHNYLEQEQDETTKVTKYLYTPLVDFEEEEEEEKEKEKEQKQNQQQQQQQQDDSKKKQLTTSATLDRVVEEFHYSKLILPENHKGIPENWLNQEILQLERLLPPNAPAMRILDSKGNDIPIDDFIQSYESAAEGKEKGLKLSSFVKVPRLVALANSVIITKQEPEQGGSNENIATNKPKEEEKITTPEKVAVVALKEENDPVAAVKTIIDKARRYPSGEDKGYFTKDEFVYASVMTPNLHYSQDQAEQILQALIEDKTIEEFEPGKYRSPPNQIFTPG